MSKKKLLNKKSLKTLTIFLIKFNLLAIPLYLVMFSGISYEPLQTFLAHLSYAIIKPLGYDIIQSGPILAVSINNQIKQIEISWDSTGWKSMYALFALTIATPTIFKRKIRFLSICLPTIFLINFLRIITTILISLRYGFQYFEIIHTLLWREGLILAVVLIWYLWLRKSYSK